MQPDVKYRPEIDGLRTIAVLPVVLFHAGIAINGGFLGVDIFYVISGFLITSILYVELDRNDFTFAKFYERRIRRIVPLLLIVLIITSCFAWIMLSPNELSRYGKSVLATLTFVSNIFFWTTTGYFSQGADNKPLLHTWSLAVEEQYYIVFPIILMFLMRFLKRYVLALLLFSMILGLGFAQFMSMKNPNFSFYMFPTRAWELLAGASAAVFVLKYGRKPNSVIAIIGLALIVASYIFGKSTMTHPGLLTIPVIAGSVFVLIFADSKNIPGKLLSLPWMVLLGKISYGIYLWHQPILAFLRLWSLKPLTLAESSLAIAGTIGLAYVTWRYIEEPFRDRKRLGIRPVYALLGVTTLLVACSGVAFAKLSFTGLPLRPRNVVIVDDRNYCPRPITLDSGKISGCLLGNTNAPPSVAVIGDSSANALRGALDEQAKAAGISIISLSVDGCAQLVGVDYRRYTGESCGTLQSRAFNYVLRTPSLSSVILANRWTLFLTQTGFDNQDGGVEHVDQIERKYNGKVETKTTLATDFPLAVRATLAPLIQQNKRVAIVYPVPESGWPMDDYLQKRFLHHNYQDATSPYSLFLSRNQPTTAKLDDATRGLTISKIYPAQHLCNAIVKDRCSLTYMGASLYIDSGHLSRSGAKLIAPDIIGAVKKKP